MLTFEHFYCFSCHDGEECISCALDTFSNLGFYFAKCFRLMIDGLTLEGEALGG